MARHRGKGFCIPCDKRVKFLIIDNSKSWDEPSNRQCLFCLDKDMKKRREAWKLRQGV